MTQYEKPTLKENTKEKIKKICPHCKYEWETRVIKPKECPRCKRRIDFTPKRKKKNK